MSEFADALEDADSEDLRGRLAQKQSELSQARSKIGELTARLEVYETQDRLLADVKPPPRWLRRKSKKRDQHRATAVAFLSDLHLDENVNPDEIGGINAFSRDVAELRLQRFFEQVPWLASYKPPEGIEYDGCVLPVGGDLVSGDIHDELKETNVGTTMETAMHWAPRLADGIRYLADEFGAVHVPWVVGNHGRQTRKPRSKRRARDNFDWLIGQYVQGSLASDDRVTFDIPDSTDAVVDIYDHRILLTHGDQVGGGGGIGGLWPPLMRLRARKLERYQSADVPFDTLICGHWHQYKPSLDLVVNGSLKGYDEFAATMNFPPEPPVQAFWTVTPERGLGRHDPIYVADRKAEGW